MPFVIVIPSLNPDENTLALVQAIRGLSSEPIVLVNDGSRPETAVFFTKMAELDHVIVLTHEKNRGKGAAIKTAIAYVSAEMPGCEGIVTADGDGQHLPEDILKVGNDLIIHPQALLLGTRNLRAKNVPFKSRWGNRITTFVFSLTSHRVVRDTQTGLRGIPRALFSLMLSVSGDRYEYEMNMLSQCALHDIAFVVVPIQTVYLDQNKHSHFKAFRDSIRIYSFLMPSIFKMAAVSLSSALLDLGLFTLFDWTFFDATATGILLSTVCSRVLSGIYNFALNKVWTFKHKGQTALKALEYGILFLTQMLLSWLLVKTFAFIPVNLTAIKAVVDFGLFIGSYFIQKKVIFRPMPSLKATAEK